MSSEIKRISLDLPKLQNPLVKSPASANHTGEERLTKRVKEIQRMINGSESKSKNSIVEATKQYGETIRAKRNSSSNTASSLKQLRYNYKNISSQLVRSKTSVNAKQVASKARREVVKLKQKIMTGKYDKEELEAAITHAKAMERAANKKARHLLEEEMVKVTDESGFDMERSNIEDRLEQRIDEAYEILDDESSQEYEENSAEQITEMESAILDSVEEINEMLSEDSEEIMDLLSEALKDMLEETLGNLADSLLTISDTEMNEEELKTIRIKHRNAEEKDMLEADAKYLKVIFDKLSRMLSGSGSGICGTADTSLSAVTPETETSFIDVSL